MRHIGIIYGGRSTEHDASIKSWDNIIHHLDMTDFLVVEEIFISRFGDISCNGNNMTFPSFIKHMCESNLCYLNLLHGQEGEDGAWSGLAELINIKGTFESTNTSSVLMNKYQQSSVVCMAFPDIMIPRSVLVNYSNRQNVLDELECMVGDKIIVKPNSMGASHFAKVFSFPYNREELLPFIDTILKYDNNVLIQEFIEGDEYTCGVYSSNSGIKTLPIIHVKSNSSFLDHHSKHIHGNVTCDFEDFPSKSLLETRSMELFNCFNIIGMCRFDFIIDDKSNIYYLEGNLIPGFSCGSAFPMMLNKAGISLNRFLVELFNAFDNKKAKEKVLRYHID